MTTKLDIITEAYLQAKQRVENGALKDFKREILSDPDGARTADFYRWIASASDSDLMLFFGIPSWMVQS